jgi:hypothetical protein
MDKTPKVSSCVLAASMTRLKEAATIIPPATAMKEKSERE